MVEYRRLDWLAQIDILRAELGVELTDTVTLTLRAKEGEQQKEVKLRASGQGGGLAQLRYGASRVLDGGVHYLRIPAMDEQLLEATVRQLEAAKDASGLVIDVRDNSGGTYAILNAIYGYFVPADAVPYVTNIACYRLSNESKPDHIFYRPTYPRDWDGWSEKERASIDRAASEFRPAWQAPAGEMSPWHYMVLSRERGKRDYYHFDRPVIVLSNAGSFSATDGFLSAFADLPQVTLMGQPSGGGSGSTRRFQLPNTGIVVALSSMASYRANGMTFDGNGVGVDVELLPTVEDFLGETDSVLEAGGREARGER